MNLRKISFILFLTLPLIQLSIVYADNDPQMKFYDWSIYSGKVSAFIYACDISKFNSKDFYVREYNKEFIKDITVKTSELLNKTKIIRGCPKPGQIIVSFNYQSIKNKGDLIFIHRKTEDVGANFYYTRGQDGKIQIPPPNLNSLPKVWNNNDSWIHQQFRTDGKTSNIGLLGPQVVSILSRMHSLDVLRGFNGIEQNMTIGDFPLWDSSITKFSDIKSFWKSRLSSVNISYPDTTSSDNFINMKEGNLSAADSLEFNNSEVVTKALSFRVNDHHHIHNFFLPQVKSTTTIGRSMTSITSNVSSFSAKGYYIKSGNDRYTLDFTKLEVVQYKLDLLKDMVTKVGSKGDVIVLDFTRSEPYFKESEPQNVRDSIMTTFLVNAVKTIKLSNPNLKVYARLPIEEDLLKEIGLLNANLAFANLDGLIVASGKSAFTSGFIPKGRLPFSSTPKVNLFEVYQLSSISRNSNSDNDIRVLVSPRQVSTFMYLARKNGYDGISRFNFHYYKVSDLYKNNFDGAYSEILCVSNPFCYNFSLQSYVSSGLHMSDLSKKSNLSTTFYAQKPENGWAQTGTLRIVGSKQGVDNLGITKWQNLNLTISLNGNVLTRISNPVVSDSISSNGFWLNPDYAKYYKFDSSLLKSGFNKITIEVNKKPTSSVFLPLVEVNIDQRLK